MWIVWMTLTLTVTAGLVWWLVDTSVRCDMADRERRSAELRARVEAARKVEG